jgi:hypothetical protein
MHKLRVGALLTTSAVALLAVGCAATHFSSQPPADARIAGDWKLDRAASDRLSTAISRLGAQLARAARARRRAAERQAEAGELPQAEGPGEGSGDEGPGEGGRTHGAERRQQSGAQAPATQDVGGPAPNSAAEQEFLASVPAGEYLRLVVGPGAFTVIAGDSSNEYSPGVESVVESTSGEATQNSGWKGARYVIDTRPRLGPELTQSFELAKDGKLALKIRMQGRGIDVSFTRIYARTTRVAPLAPPTNS